MKERESRKDVPQIPFYFTFFCPTNRENDAKELLKSINEVSLSSVSEPEEFLVIDFSGRASSVYGLMMSGISYLGAESLVKSLAKKNIAGYSFVTRVHFDELIEERLDSNIFNNN